MLTVAALRAHGPGGHCTSTQSRPIAAAPSPGLLRAILLKQNDEWAVQRAQDVLFAFARQDLDERPSRRLPVTRLIADALAPNHPFAEPIGVASNYHAAIIVVILLDDAATATFISIIVASIIVDPWTSRTNFDSDLSVSGRPGGGRDQAE